MTVRYVAARAGIATSALCLLLSAGSARAVCVGDCSGDGSVTINELILGVNIALGSQPVSACPSFDCQNNGTVPINCLIQGVNNALGSCPAENTPTETPPVGENTPTVTPPVGDTATPTATPTGTAAALCPLPAGVYTITNADGGTLQVAGIGAPNGFAFPTGGTVVQDVSAATAPDCVHNTVVPAEGGFTAPAFCIMGLNFTVKVVQDGCGIGQIDSNGGSDYTIVERGDTSDSSTTCNLPNPGCPPGPPSQTERDTSLRVDITVGDGTPDTCAGGGTGNAIVTIPVRTTTWVPPDFSCPDPDGTFNGDDALVLLISQNLDFTTDTNSASWVDIDGDGCSISGSGPANGLTRTGVCIDFDAQTVTTAAAGTIGSDGSPLFDLTFATRLPNTLSGPAAPMGATCDTPPVIDFGGTATRCIP